MTDIDKLPWKVLTTSAPGTPEWLAARKGKIGGHDAASILGLGRKTPLQVWAELTLKEEPTPEPDAEDEDDEGSPPSASEQMELGTELEPVVASRYTKRTGRKLLDAPGVIQHPELNWLIASPDRLIVPDALHPEMGVFEAKTTGGIREKEWAIEPPIEAQIQVQLYMEVMRLTHGAIAALVGTYGFKILTSDVAVNEAFREYMMNELVNFYDRHVITDIPPEPRGDDLALVKQMYRNPTATEIELLPEIEDDFEELEQVKANMKLLKGTKDDLEARIRSFVGLNTYARGARVSLSLKESKNPGGTRVIAPYTYRTIRRMK